MHNFHNQDFHHIVSYIKEPNKEHFHQWKNIPFDYLVDALNLLPIDSVSGVLLGLTSDQKAHLLKNYKYLSNWKQLDVFRHIHDSHLVWKEEELTWLSDFHLEDVFRKVKDLFIVSLEQHFITTGMYNVLFFELSYDASIRCIEQQPTILNEFDMQRRYSLFDNIKNNPGRLDTAKFLFRYDVDCSSYWDSVQKSFCIASYKDLIFQYKEKAPKGFWAEWLRTNEVTAEEEWLLLDVLSQDDITKVVSDDCWHLWRHSFEQCEQRFGADLIKKYVNVYCLGDEVDYAESNLQWIIRNFRSNSVIKKDFVKALTYDSLKSIYDDYRAEGISFRSYANIMMYHLLTISANTDYQKTMDALYSAPFQDCFNTIIESFNLEGLALVPSLECPLPHRLVQDIAMQEIPLYE